MKPHKHAEVIKAWADGAQIQVFSGGYWIDIDPTWQQADEYRVKPAEPEKVYPSTALTYEEMVKAYNDAGPGLHGIANTALRHACDNGQIVTREEFDRSVGDRKARDLNIAQAISDKVFKASTSRDPMPMSVADFLDIIKGVPNV